MTEHVLKTWRNPFQATWDRTKLHEVRVNDRDFHVGDRLRLSEWNALDGRFTGRWILADVTYMTVGATWGLPEHLCVMSIREIARGEVL